MKGLVKQLILLSLISMQCIHRTAGRPQSNYDVLDVGNGVGGQEVLEQGVPRKEANMYPWEKKPIFVDTEDSYGLLGSEGDWKMHGTHGKAIEAEAASMVAAQRANKNRESADAASYGDPAPIQPGAIPSGGSGGGDDGGGSGGGSGGSGGDNESEAGPEDDLIDPREMGVPDDQLNALMPQILVQKKVIHLPNPRPVVDMVQTVNDPNMYIGRDGYLYRGLNVPDQRRPKIKAQPRNLNFRMLAGSTTTTTTTTPAPTSKQPHVPGDGIWKILICILLIALVIAIVVALYIAHQKRKKREALVVSVNQPDPRAAPIVTVSPIDVNDESSAT